MLMEQKSSFFTPKWCEFYSGTTNVDSKGKNTFVFAVDGNFDIAQTNVKKLLNDPELASELSSHGYQFSSANSINIGRLFPQVVYYFYAYAQMIQQKEFLQELQLILVCLLEILGIFLLDITPKKWGFQ